MIFFPDLLNPNGCSAKGTFFVSHKYTNYSAVQEFHRRGHEIGVFSITTRNDPKYWSKGTYDDWLAEMAGDRYTNKIHIFPQMNVHKYFFKINHRTICQHH